MGLNIVVKTGYTPAPGGTSTSGGLEIIKTLTAVGDEPTQIVTAHGLSATPKSCIVRDSTGQILPIYPLCDATNITLWTSVTYTNAKLEIFTF